jgi:hypothetical protein
MTGPLEQLVVTEVVQHLGHRPLSSSGEPDYGFAAAVHNGTAQIVKDLQVEFDVLDGGGNIIGRLVTNYGSQYLLVGQDGYSNAEMGGYYFDGIPAQARAWVTGRLSDPTDFAARYYLTPQQAAVTLADLAYAPNAPSSLQSLGVDYGIYRDGGGRAEDEPVPR